MKKSELIQQVKGYVQGYEEANGGPVSLYILNRRWNARCKEVLGVSLKQFIESRSSVFKTKIGVTGGLMVCLREEHGLAQLLRVRLSEAGGEMKAGEVMESLKGSGYTMQELISQGMYLIDLGEIELKDGVYRLMLEE